MPKGRLTPRARKLLRKPKPTRQAVARALFARSGGRGKAGSLARKLMRKRGR